MKTLVMYSLLITLFTGCTQINKPMQLNKNAVECLNQFKNKQKFQQQNGPNFYPGLSRPNVLPVVSEIINQSADDFLKVVQSNASEEEFRKQIQAGLKRFDAVHLELDTEDRE